MSAMKALLSSSLDCLNMGLFILGKQGDCLFIPFLMFGLSKQTCLAQLALE